MLDDRGRPLVTPDQLERIRAGLAEIPEGKRGAFVVIGYNTGARLQLALNTKRGWQVVTGIGWDVGDSKPNAFFAVKKTF